MSGGKVQGGHGGGAPFSVMMPTPGILPHLDPNRLLTPQGQDSFHGGGHGKAGHGPKTLGQLLKEGFSKLLNGPKSQPGGGGH